jgi:chromosome segregation ATPase
LSIKEKIASLRKEEQRLTRQHNTLSQDQDRVRANLNVLRKTKGNAGLQQELAAKLARLETELGKLSGARVQLSEEVAEHEAKLRALIKDVTLE